MSFSKTSNSHESEGREDGRRCASSRVPINPYEHGRTSGTQGKSLSQNVAVSEPIRKVSEKINEQNPCIAWVRVCIFKHGSSVERISSIVKQSSVQNSSDQRRYFSFIRHFSY